MASNKSIKKRYWAMVVYPESLPSDWLDILQGTGLAFAISPLHDKDVNPDGEEKKAHYHLIGAWSGPTTFSSVKQLTDRLNAPHPTPLESVRGYYRYLTHKDNPEKYQYEEKDIRLLNGFDIGEFIELTKGEVDKFIREIHDYILQNDITEYCDLCDALFSDPDLSNSSTLYNIAVSHTMFFNSYLRSRRYKAQGKAVCKHGSDDDVFPPPYTETEAKRKRTEDKKKQA